MLGERRRGRGRVPLRPTGSSARRGERAARGLPRLGQHDLEEEWQALAAEEEERAAEAHELHLCGGLGWGG